MYIKRRKNQSGSTSVQIIEKRRGSTRLVKTIGSSVEEQRINELEQEARDYLTENEQQLSLAINTDELDAALERYFVEGNHPIVRMKGPELVLGKVFDEIGFNKIEEPLFRHLVLARLTYPVSKLKTTQYLSTHQQEEIDISSVYRFLDRFHRKYKVQVEQIAFEHSKRVLDGKISVVFYDMTTLYFEAEDEDDLRKVGFSKDGKFQHPQIMLGLLVGENGYPIAYDIYEGNTFEGHTLVPAISRAQQRFGLDKPIIIADSALLSRTNLAQLREQDYVFIIGARIKNESREIQEQILSKSKSIKNSAPFVIDLPDGLKLIVGYSDKRAKKDASNRERGIARLKSKIKTGKIRKASIVNRGYNKFLTIESDVSVSIDENKVLEDQKWDGLKGYVTNSKLRPQVVISNYNQLWKIERAFRISKTDLRIRPIFHRRKDRIAAHITIAFAAYSVFKELERKLELLHINISPLRVIELTKTIFEIQFRLPNSRKKLSTFNKLTPEQHQILEKLV